MSLFSLGIFLLVVVIAYFHYLQGMFSATLSAIFAILAAVLAVSYQEPLERLLSRGGMADYAMAITLVALFAGIYLILRVTFDSLVPGNLRLPLWVDRIGAAAMGVVAGLFATGIIALAAQSLPFGPSIAYYSQYELNADRPVRVPPGGNQVQFRDLTLSEELKNDTFTEDSRHGLFPPSDALLVGLVNHLSNGGSLAGGQKFAAVHPDYLQELFGSRLGIQVGAKRTIINDNPSQPQVRVVGVYLMEGPVKQIDAEIDEIRKRDLPDPLTVPADEALLVVRAVFSHNASDADNLIRLSPAAVRLVVNQTDYHPIGTLERSTVLIANREDDSLFLEGGKDGGADFVFRLDKSVLTDGAVAGAAMPKGAFFEAKRLGRVDLTPMEIKPTIELQRGGAEIKVLRKPKVMEKTGLSEAPPKEEKPAAAAPASKAEKGKKADRAKKEKAATTPGAK